MNKFSCLVALLVAVAVVHGAVQECDTYFSIGGGANQAYGGGLRKNCTDGYGCLSATGFMLNNGTANVSVVVKACAACPALACSAVKDTLLGYLNGVTGPTVNYTVATCTGSVITYGNTCPTSPPVTTTSEPGATTTAGAFRNVIGPFAMLAAFLAALVM